MNKEKLKYKLKDLYDVAGFSKQAHSKYMKNREKEEAITQLTISSILGVRSIHSQMGFKKIYKLLSPEWIGRDRFIDIGVEYGLGIRQHKSFHRTTFSCKSAWFTNLTAGLEITGINQVWVSDITYYRLADIFYYLTFIEDVYSRRIVGWRASTNLRAEGNCKALKKAFTERQGHELRGMIHHSDRGTQYVSDAYLKMLSDKQIAVSMCKNVYENTHIERVNGIIKNEYLYHKSIKTFSDLQRFLNKAVWLYNKKRPHWSLGLMSPCEYEKKLESIPAYERDIMKIYSEDKRIYVQQSFFN